jgi:hypothetical protein
MDFVNSKDIVLASISVGFGFLSFVCYRIYIKWNEGDIFKTDIKSLNDDLRYFKETMILRTTSLEQQITFERQERNQMMIALEQRIYDLMSDFKKDVKEDFKSIESKIEQNTKKEEDWRKTIDDKITLLLTNRGIKQNEN